MQSVAETPLFMAQAAKLFSEEERVAIIIFLATNPEAGDVIQGTGGVRKVRVPASGRGKRGGARVIYYFHSAAIPLYALAVYAKNVKADLSSDEKKALAALARTLRP